MQAFDIIGDIHGHYRELTQLLSLLGYKVLGGVWKHKEGRKALFIGDYIDRGSDNVKVLELIHGMVTEGTGFALMGNHEYNCLALHTPKDPSFHGRKSQKVGFLRPPTAKNLEQASTTLHEFEKFPNKRDELLAWLYTLPLFLEFEGIRAVHACWDTRQIEFISSQLQRKTYPGGYGYCLSKDFLQNSAVPGSAEFYAVETLLKGKEGNLPEGSRITGEDGQERSKYRLKWWLGSEELAQARTLTDIALVPAREAQRLMTNHWFQEQKRIQFERFGYGVLEKPIFFGHYWLKGTPRLLSSNIACVDFSVARNGCLACYSWNGENELKAQNFTWVDKAS